MCRSVSFLLPASAARLSYWLPVKLGRSQALMCTFIRSSCQRPTQDIHFGINQNDTENSRITIYVSIYRFQHAKTPTRIGWTCVAQWKVSSVVTMLRFAGWRISLTTLCLWAPQAKSPFSWRGTESRWPTLMGVPALVAVSSNSLSIDRSKKIDHWEVKSSFVSIIWNYCYTS